MTVNAVKEISKQEAYDIIKACEVMNKKISNNYLIKENDKWSALFITKNNDTLVEEFDSKESALDWLEIQKQ